MQRYTGTAFLAATLLAIEAYASLSPFGAFFLLLYLAWGLIASRPSSASRAVAACSLALWSAASAAAFLALLLQLLQPLLPPPAGGGSGGGPTAGSGGGGGWDLAWWIFGLHDVMQPGWGRRLALLAPPLLCGLASLAEALAASRHVQRLRQHPHPPRPHSAGGPGEPLCGRGGYRPPASGAASQPPVAAFLPAPPPPRAAAEPGKPAAAAAAAGTNAQPPQPPAAAGAGAAAAEGSGSRRGSARSLVSAEGGAAAWAARGAGGGGVEGGEGGAAAAVACCALMACAVLLWPAAFNLPWLLVASLGVAAWACRTAALPPAVHAPLLRLGQAYSALTLVVLYGYQLLPPGAWPRGVARAVRALGLYRLHRLGDAVHGPGAAPLYDLVPQLLHLAAITALYGALGFAARAAAERHQRLRRRRSSGRRVAHGATHGPVPTPSDSPAVGLLSAAAEDEDENAEGEASASEALPASPKPFPSRASAGTAAADAAGSALRAAARPPPARRPSFAVRAGSGAAAAAAAVYGEPGVAAVALACLSMVEVSALGGAMLLAGMWALLAPRRYGRAMLRRCSPALTLLLLAWNAAVYVATCLAAAYPGLLPPVLHSAGVFMYVSPPPVVLPLAGQALAILAMAGLARTSTGIRQKSTAGGGAGAGGHMGQGRGVAVPAGSGVLGMGTSAGLTFVLLSYHALNVLVPASWILLGSYRLDLLHGAYLAWLLRYGARTVFRLSPDPQVRALLPVGHADVSMGSNGYTPLPAAPPAHRLFRLYASAHLMVLYGAMCGRLPGLGGLQPAAWEGVLRPVGLWHPRLPYDCLPLLGALVLATAHAVTGNALRDAATAVATAAASAAQASAVRIGGGGGSGSGGQLLLQQQPRQQPAVAAWAAALGCALASCAASAGAQLIAVLLYALVLYDMRVGLLGLGYVVLGLPLLLAPPRRVRYQQRLQPCDELGTAAAAPGTAAAAPGTAAAAPGTAPAAPGTAASEPTWRLQLAGTRPADIASWLPPAALALYAAADLALTYAAAAIDTYIAAGDVGPAQAGWLRVWRRAVWLVLGGPAPGPGGRLVASLARPAGLLLALQLYRWAFAAAAVLKWRRRQRRQQGAAAGGPQPQPPRLPAPTPLPQPPTPMTRVAAAAWAPAAAAAAAAPALGPAGPPAMSAAGIPAASLTAAAAQPGQATHGSPRRPDLDRQASCAWLARRWLILNADLICVVLLFAVLMASPGALAAGALAAAAACALAAAWLPGAAAVRPRAPGGGGVSHPVSPADDEEVHEDTAAAEGAVGGGGGGAHGSCRTAARVGESAAAASLFALSQALLVGWLLALYALQLQPVASWVARSSGAPGGGGGGGGEPPYRPWSPAAALDWLGLPLCTLPPEPSPPAQVHAHLRHGVAGLLRALLAPLLEAPRLSGDPYDSSSVACAPAAGTRLRLVVLLLALAALALRRKARWWREALPPEVAAAAARGQPCCLFWPPPGGRADGQVLPWLGPRAAVARAVRRAVAPASAVAGRILSRLGRGAVSVLKAMDVPAEQLALLGEEEGEERTQAAAAGAPSHSRSHKRLPQHPPAPPLPPLTGPHDSAASSHAGAHGVTTPTATLPGPPTPSAAGLGRAASGGSGASGAPPAAAAAAGVRPSRRRLAPAGAAVPPADGLQREWNDLNGLGSNEGTGNGGGGGGGWVLGLRLVVRGCMEAAEGWWAAWGGEAAQAALLLAAFTAANAVALPLLAALGAGMAAGPRAQAALRRTVLLPLLCTALLYQYCAWAGLPRLLLPPLGAAPPFPPAHRLAHMRPELAGWLGLEGAGPLALWTLFGAAIACLMQVNSELPDVLPERRPRRGWRRLAGGRQPGGAGGEADLEAPLLPPPPDASLPPQSPEVQAALQAPTSPQKGAAAAAPGGPGEGGGGTGAVRRRPAPLQVPPHEAVDQASRRGVHGGGGGKRTRLFRPVEPGAQPSWGLLDWARYYAVRHASDALLVGLVGLVASRRDLLAAGYLAHALLLFRRRPQLAAPPGPGGAAGGLVGRLVAFNFCVLLLEGAFQAPWDLLLGRSWAVPCSATLPGGAAPPALSCTLPRLMGLCRLQPVPDAASDPRVAGPTDPWAPWRALLHSPVLADLVVWALLRLYLRLLRAPLFEAVARVAAAQAAARAAGLAEAEADELEGAARGALAASHARAVRGRRIGKLKALLLGPEAGVFVEAPPWYPGQRPAPGARPGDPWVGGAPAVSRGLAELLDSDVDLAELAAAAAESEGNGTEAPPQRAPPQQAQRGHRAQEGAGGGAQGDAAAAAGGRSRGGAIPRRSWSYTDLDGLAHEGGAVVAEDLYGSSPPQGTAMAAAAGAADARRSLGHRRVVSVTAMEDVGRDLGGNGVGGSGGALQEAAAPPQPQRARRRRFGRLSVPPLLTRLWRAAAARVAAVRQALASRRTVYGDDDSYACYAAYLLLFLCDFSALSAALPLSMSCYALLLRCKPRRYWQAALLYGEACLIAQYSYLVLGRCLCATGAAGGGGGASCFWVFARRGFLFDVQVLGLHSDPLRALPLFLAYLTTLVHSYSLQRRTAAEEAAVAAEAAAAAGAAVTGAPEASAAAAEASAGTAAAARAAPGAQVAAGGWPPAGALSRRGVARAAAEAAAGCGALVRHLADVYSHVTSDHELPPHWIKLQLPPAPHPPAARRGAGPPAARGPRGMPTAGGEAGGEALAAMALALPGIAATAPAALEVVEEGGGAVPAPLGRMPSAPAAVGMGTFDIAAAAAAAGGGYPRTAPLAAAGPGAIVSDWAGGGRGGGLSAPALAAALQGAMAAVHAYDGEVRRWEGERQRRRRAREAARQWLADEQPGEGSDSEAEAEAAGERDRADRAATYAAVAATYAAVAAHGGVYGVSRYALPHLRVQHVAVGAGGDTHVLLQVLPRGPPPTHGSLHGGGGREPWEGQEEAEGAEAGAGGEQGGPRPSPTPARHAAAMLRFAVEAAQEQGAAAQVPSFAARRAGHGTATASLGASRTQLPPLPPSTSDIPTAAIPTSTAMPPPPPAAAADLQPNLEPSPPASPPASLDADAEAAGAAGLRRRRPPSYRAPAAAPSAAAAPSPGPPSPSPPPPALRMPPLPPIASIEHYSRPPADLYTATACLDLASFAYALVFYQLVSSRAASLADIADSDRVLPLDYLAALMTLFVAAVAERAVYVLGAPRGKAALHAVSQVLVLGWCLRAFWGAAAAEAAGVGGDGDGGGGGGSVRQHLRVFVLLRCLGVCLGALQLRTGYPPLSAPGPAGGGRASSFFYRRPDWAHSLAFTVFYGIPFLYEVRLLLDWTCSATALDWASWLKLEDIRASLFAATCRNNERRGRRLGDRVPRYVKFSQGFLALLALLLVLWLPPLFFSSGAPTYQVPALLDVRLNISITKTTSGPDGVSLERFPLFATGDRRQVFNWRPPPPPPQPPQPPAVAGSNGPGAELGEGTLLTGGGAAATSRRRAASVWVHGGRDGGAEAAEDGVWRAGSDGRGAPPPPSPPPPPPPPPPRAPGLLPRALSGYLPEQVKGACVAADSDTSWRLTPPARAALLRLLDPAAEGTRGVGAGGGEGGSNDGGDGGGGGGGGGGGPVVLEVRWSLLRSAPLASQRGGGPGCSAAAAVPLSAPSRLALVELLLGRANSTGPLTALNATDPATHGSAGLFPLFLRLRGDTCSVRLGLQGDAPVAAASGLAAVWPPRAGGPIPGMAAAATAAEDAERWGAAMVGCTAALRSAESGGPGEQWWAFECGALLPPAPGQEGGDEGGGEGGGGYARRRSGAGGGAEPEPGPQGDGGDGGGGQPRDACGGAGGGSRGLHGPPLVAVLEPVQSGLLGATLSRFGITGLYFTFVFAIGRFLRLAVSGGRARIPTEDLPSTRRLVALCQDIAVARAEGELLLEEQLYTALINVYRQPALLFQLSARKHKRA